MTDHNEDLPISHGLATAVLRARALESIGSAGGALRELQGESDPVVLAKAEAALRLTVSGLRAQATLTDDQARAVLDRQGVTLCSR